MSYDKLDIETGNDKYISIKAGESVQLHLESKDAEKSVSHWIEKKKYVCEGKGCQYCASGNKKKQGWKANATDRKDGLVKEWEFGPQIAAQLKNIAELLRESGQTIHDIDLRIKRVGSDMETEYFVNNVPKKTPQNIADEAEVPF